MANLTRAQMISRILEHLGVKPVGQSASAEDAAIVGEALDSAHQRLRKEGLAPFATSAIPEWAQTPFRDYVAGDITGSFGVGGEKLQIVLAAKQMGKQELARQTMGSLPAVPVKPYWF